MVAKYRPSAGRIAVVVLTGWFYGFLVFLGVLALTLVAAAVTGTALTDAGWPPLVLGWSGLGLPPLFIYLRLRREYRRFLARAADLA